MPTTSKKQLAAPSATTPGAPLLKARYRRDFNASELKLIAAGDVEKAKRRWEKRQNKSI